MKEEIYTFTFNIRGTTNCTYKVWSYDKQDLIMFINQHNFVDGIKHVIVEYVDTTKDVDSNSVIETWIFGSNKMNGTYEIYTTNKLIEDATQSVCVQLNETMTFGPALLKTEFPVIEYINKQMEMLPYTSPKEYECEHVEEEYYNGTILKKIDHDDYIFTALFDQLIHFRPLPITIESYVTYFAEYMLGDVQ